MSFIKLTRADGSAIAVKVDEILNLTPVPASGPSAGPLTVGTRITYKGNAGHQDVKEEMDVVLEKINNAT